MQRTPLRELKTRIGSLLKQQSSGSVQQREQQNPVSPKANENPFLDPNSPNYYQKQEGDLPSNSDVDFLGRLRGAKPSSYVSFDDKNGTSSNPGQQSLPPPGASPSRFRLPFRSKATFPPKNTPSTGSASSYTTSNGNGSSTNTNKPATMTSYPGSVPHPGGPPPPGAHTGPQQAPGVAGVPDSYFTESRKGEVNELRNLLRNFATERDPQRKRDIIKKVIAYMTLGIDVSRLFTEMMLAIETRDLVIKKMVYLFLCNYATTHPELAQMCTNTLQKDCGNEDPMVRGLALRALCSLRLPQMVEYISEPLRRSLTDGHAYVRKTGVMGILKLYHLDKEAFERCNFTDILYDMLRDSDASVVTNCIIVLNELMAKSPNGGMAINRAIMLHLLNRIHEFSEFGVLQVIELIPRYIPANEEEGFQIMNLLDPVLRTSNSGAILATIRAFLSLAEQFTDDMEGMKRQVINRVKAPLVTLVASGSAELMYCLLKNVEALVDLCPAIFDDEYRQFYIRFHEPTHIKHLKLTILAKMANPDNAPDIVAELAELATHTDVKLGRLAIRSMNRIACRNVGGAGCEQSIARRLVEFLDMNVDHICSEAAAALAHLYRKHPSLKNVIAPPLARSIKYVQDPSGKASIIFLLGECGDVIREAPYVLEKLIDNYDSLEDATVKVALLTSTMKLFFLRPPEVQRMLGRLLAKATDDVSSQDLHDRALLYYRLMRTDPKTVEAVIKTNSAIPSHINFAEEEDEELQAALMEEFNTLSTIYGKKSNSFIKPEYQVKYVKMPDNHPLAPGTDTGVVQPPARSAADNAAPPASAAPAQPAVTAEAAPAAAAGGGGGVMDLLGFDSPAPAPAAPPAPAPAASAASVALQPNSTLSGDEYQSHWGAIPDSESDARMVALSSLPPSTDVVEQTMAAVHVQTMASGDLPTEFKFFFYAKDTTGDIFLMQGNVNKTPNDPMLILTIKKTGSPSSAKIDQLVTMIQNALT